MFYCKLCLTIVDQICFCHIQKVTSISVITICDRRLIAENDQYNFLSGANWDALEIRLLQLHFS